MFCIHPTWKPTFVEVTNMFKESFIIVIIIIFCIFNVNTAHKNKIGHLNLPTIQFGVLIQTR